MVQPRTKEGGRKQAVKTREGRGNERAHTGNSSSNLC